MILDVADHVGGYFFSLDGPFQAKRKIILDVAGHVDGRLFSLNGRFFAKIIMILDGTKHVEGWLFSLDCILAKTQIFDWASMWTNDSFR